MPRRYFPAAPRHHALVGGALLTALALLSGCKEEKKTPAPAPSATLLDHVLEATQQSIRAAGSPAMRFRGSQVYTQGMPQRMAVCGQVDPFADDPEIFVPFVSIVTLPLSQDGRSPQYQFEHFIGSSTSAASRVYVAIVEYCYDKGGPTPGPYRSVRATPPLPEKVPDLSPQGRAAQAAPPPTSLQVQPPSLPPVAQTASSGTVTMRQNGNLRSDPHGPSLRVIPQGTALHVFAQSAGGWYQVGDTAPWGWMHESMLDVTKRQ